MGKGEFRWGILGPGRIARKFATSLPFSKNGKLVAVASSSAERAASFAAEFGASHHFDSYEALADSGLVDAIYIATPHSFHRRNAEMCLQKGVPVLCEKPLSVSKADSQHLISLSREKGIFLMEGLWTSCLPGFLQALHWVKEGKIGELLHAEADFGHAAPMNPEHRHFNPELGGGVMKDIGIYPLCLFMKVLDHGLRIQSSGIRLKNGIDVQVVFQGCSASGKASFQGMVSFLGSGRSEACVTGTEGKIRFDTQWFRPVQVSLEIPGKEPVYFRTKKKGFGFQFEADEVARCVRSGLIESPLWTHADSLEAARLIALAEAF